MRTLSLVVTLVVFAFPCFASDPSNAPLVTKDQIIERGDWSFHQILLREHTRSQLVVGKLKFKGKEVLGDPNHVLETSFGLMVFYPYPANVHVSFGSSGWTPAREITDKMIEATLGREFSYWTTDPKKK